MEDGPRTRLNYSDFGILINAGGKFIIRNCKISSISIGIILSVGVSAGPIHLIEGVEINNSGLGIYSYWPNKNVNISKCNVSNCNWVTIKAPDDFDTPALYGGYGIWLRGTGLSKIEYCCIQNCSIGMVATSGVDLIGNQLINCGLSFHFMYGIPLYRVNNTVNGKPIGLFYGEDNLIISGQEASQYGQLIFFFCDNLQLYNIHIKDPCSIGIILYRCEYPLIQNIVCENQKIGFLFIASEITADYLHTKHCDAGFFLIQTRDSTFTRLFMDNTDIPIYTITPIINCTFEIEKSTRFYIIDIFAFNELQLNTSVSSYIVNRSFLSAFDLEGFLIQINDTNTYHITDPDPGEYGVDIIIVIYQPSFAIPGFSAFWFYMIILLGIVYLIVSYSYKKR